MLTNFEKINIGEENGVLSLVPTLRKVRLKYKQQIDNIFQIYKSKYSCNDIMKNKFKKQFI